MTRRSVVRCRRLPVRLFSVSSDAACIDGGCMSICQHGFVMSHSENAPAKGETPKYGLRPTFPVCSSWASCHAVS